MFSANRCEEWTVCARPFRTPRYTRDGGGAVVLRHEFGGDWTSRKLSALQKYLNAYTTALKNQAFDRVYVDAFAGTGTRARRSGGGTPIPSLFSDSGLESASDLLDGSARIALQTQPPFSRYVFVDQDPEHCASLESLKPQFPESNVEVICGDGNEEIRRVCDTTNWRGTRAVMFVDPYGMQVEWSTIERIAATRAADLWLLFPLGIGVNRLLKRDGDLPESWRSRLNVLLGTTEWEREFYRVEPVRTLFGTDESRIEKASMDVIGRYFNDRLRSIFPAVAERPGILWNSRRSPLYLFCFAAANPGRGGEIALKIANHILKDLT